MRFSGKPNLVLAGAGHAHLYTIKRAASLVGRGANVTVISPGQFWYSGLATGMLGGFYPPELDQVDVAGMAEHGGASFKRAQLREVDHSTKTIVLDDDTTLPFDILSINIGSACNPIPGANERCYSVKPIESLAGLRRNLEQLFSSSNTASPAIAVAGGGVTAFEIAGNIEALSVRQGRSCNITIICGSMEPLHELPAEAAHRVTRNFHDRGIRIETNCRVNEICGEYAKLSSGNQFRFDYFINATGLIPNTSGMTLQLSLDASGGICIDHTLRASGHANIFAAGDCASLEGRTLPKIGVFAIRQAPILFHNILALLDGTPLKRFTPQRQYLSIITLGDGNALATRGPHWWFGRLAFQLKDWIDRRFLRSIRSR